MGGCDPNSVVTGALYVAPGDPAAADSNDGRLVSEGGTGPWKTINHGIYNLAAGDTLYIRGGNYVAKYPMYVRNDYTSKTKGGDPSIEMKSATGTAAAPVNVRGYPCETVTIDLKAVGPWIALDNKSYWNFSDLKFTNAGGVFEIGEDSSKSTHNTIRNIEVEHDRGGDNLGAFRVVNGNGENTTIENCKIVGAQSKGAQVHGNTNGIFARVVENLVIRNVEISFVPIGIYFKHANPGVGTNITIENNYIHDTSRNAMQVNAKKATIANNIFGANNAPVLSSEANGKTGGDDNSYLHNTFYRTGLALTADNQGSEADPGSLRNIVRNNLFFDSRMVIHEYSTAPHQTTSDYNTYDRAQPVREFGVDYSLAAWTAKSGQDANSKGGSISFQGGATPKAPGDFKLTGAGVAAASDGKDSGADVASVGYK